MTINMQCNIHNGSEVTENLYAVNASIIFCSLHKLPSHSDMPFGYK